MIRHRNKPPRSPSHALTAVGCIVFAGVCASIPYVITTNQKEALMSKEDALNAGAIRRGVYVNSGSKDVGVDPMWDFKQGKRRRQDLKDDHADDAANLFRMDERRKR